MCLACDNLTLSVCPMVASVPVYPHDAAPNPTHHIWQCIWGDLGWRWRLQMSHVVAVVFFVVAFVTVEEVHATLLSAPPLISPFHRLAETYHSHRIRRLYRPVGAPARRQKPAVGQGGIRCRYPVTKYGACRLRAISATPCDDQRRGCGGRAGG